MHVNSVQQFLVFLNPFDHKNVLPPSPTSQNKNTLVYPIPVRNLDVKNRRLKNSYLLDVPKTVDRKSHSLGKPVDRKNHSRTSTEKVIPGEKTVDRKSHSRSSIEIYHPRVGRNIPSPSSSVEKGFPLKLSPEESVTRRMRCRSARGDSRA